VSAAALQQREGLVCRGRDDRAELVEHARPQRSATLLGFDGAGVNVVEDDRGDGLGLVRHDIDVRAPQHDRALPDRAGEPHTDRLACGVGARREDAAPGFADDQREAHETAAERLLALPA
jgi:hypothetical protein